MKTTQFTTIEPITLDYLNSVRGYGDTIYLRPFKDNPNHTQFFCFNAKLQDKNDDKKIKRELVNCHFRVTGVLEQSIVPGPIKLSSKFIPLLKQFKTPELRFYRNNIEVREQGKNKTKELFNEYEAVTKTPYFPRIKEEDIDFQLKLKFKEFTKIKEWLELMKPKKGRFVNGNPNRSKVIFKKEKKTPIVRVEDRNCGVFTVALNVNSECISNDYEYILTNFTVRELPNDHFQIQMSKNDYLSEWYGSDYPFLYSLDLTKRSYVKI